MRYIGLDVHKQVIEAAFVDAAGELIARRRFACTREAIASFIDGQLEATDAVALESTTNTWSIVDLLEPHVAQIVVSNPVKIRAIAEAKIKTDKVDAEVLAQLLRCDYLPQVWIPDAVTRQVRLLTHRTDALPPIHRRSLPARRRLRATTTL